MSDPDRPYAVQALSTLERLIDRMDALGRDAENATGRVTAAMGGAIASQPPPQQEQLVSAIGDVIEIVTERSKLAHEAHRVISELRRREFDSSR